MVDTFRNIFGLLTPRLRRRFFGVFALMGLLMGMELLCAALISLFAVAMTTPEAELPSLGGGVLMRYAPWLVHAGMAGVIGWVGAAAALGIVLKNAVSALFTYLARHQAASVGEHLGQLLFSSLLFAPYPWHLRQNSAQLALAVQGREYALMLLDGVQQVCVGVMLSASVCAALVVMDPVAAGLVLGGFGLLGVLMFLGVKRAIDRHAASLHGVEVSISKCVLMSLQGIKELKLYCAESAFLKRYRDELLRTPAINASLATWVALPSQLLEVLAIGGLVAFVWAMYAVLGRSTAQVVGIAGFLSVACWRVLPTLNRVFGSMTGIRRSIPRLEMYLTCLREARAGGAGVAQGTEEGVLAPFARELMLDGVTYAYDGAEAPALREITLRIPRGTAVGVVGVSGAGKSTLVDLLTGLLAPDAGYVAVDGAALSTPELRRAWMHRVGYVAQTPYLLDATLAENVAFGVDRGRIDRDRVLECCRQAAMGDFLDGLPQGLDTELGERGVLLSGGQRQRVAIARALYLRPEVLILDEATSALDTRNEELILRTARELRSSLTQIVVAHRLSTVEDCDTVVWLDRGRIRMQGPAPEVVAAYRAYLGEEGREESAAKVEE